MSGFVFQETPPEVLAKVMPLYAELAALQMQRALVILAHKYRPDQPRIPEGSHGGGQWTYAGGIRLAGGVEDDEPSRAGRSPVIENSPAELRQEDFNNSIRTLRRLEPNNPNLETLTDGSAPEQAVVDSYRDEAEAAKDRIANRISSGHALIKHAAEFGFPSQAQLQAIVRGILDNPSRIDDLPDSRTGYYDRPSNTFILVNPAARDGGTIYKLQDGEAYIDTLHNR